MQQQQLKTGGEIKMGARGKRALGKCFIIQVCAITKLFFSPLTISRPPDGFLDDYVELDRESRKEANSCSVFIDTLFYP